MGDRKEAGGRKGGRKGGREGRERGGRKGGGLCIDAKGQLSGADDSVCVFVCVLVCVICAWLRAFVSILIHLCLTAWHMCLLCDPVCVCVCVCVLDEAPGLAARVTPCCAAHTAPW